MKRWIVGVKLRNKEGWHWFCNSSGLCANQQKAHMFNRIELAKDKFNHYRLNMPAYYIDAKIVQFECTEEEMK